VREVLRRGFLILALLSTLLNFEVLREFHYYDSDGKKISTDELKGNFTLMLFYNPANKIATSALKFFDELAGEYPSLNCVAICVACNRKLTQTLVKGSLKNLSLYFSGQDLKDSFKVSRVPLLLVLTPELGIYRVIKEPTPGDIVAEARYLRGLKIEKRSVELHSGGFIIKGTLFRSNKPRLTPVIMFHMLNGTRKDYDELAEDYAYLGSTVLTVDLRGHGDSQCTEEGKRVNWREFSTGDFVSMVNDGRKAMELLLKEAGAKKCYILGASLGANIGLNLATSEEVAKVVALSPGLNYRGVKTETIAKRLTIPVLLVASKKDEYAYRSALRLNRLLQKSRLLLYDGGYHGTDLLNDSPYGEELKHEIEKFFFENDVEWEKEE
jgi:pimeloyl-ACP methyl ester carboxylesterase